MTLIAGIDEVGRGPLAGPVVAAAVVFPPRYRNSEIKDSKILPPETRAELAKVIKQESISWAIVAVGPRRIEQLNIRQATRVAMTAALARVLKRCPEVKKVEIDGNMTIDLPGGFSHLIQRTIIGGDALRVHISAASIIAKEWRDAQMRVLAERFPHYGFESNVGYPTPFHLEALRAHGPIFIHRKTFRGVSQLIEARAALPS